MPALRASVVAPRAARAESADTIPEPAEGYSRRGPIRGFIRHAVENAEEPQRPLPATAPDAPRGTADREHPYREALIFLATIVAAADVLVLLALFAFLTIATHRGDRMTLDRTMLLFAPVVPVIFEVMAFKALSPRWIRVVSDPQHVEAR